MGDRVQEYDRIVVGGGGLGASIAYFLSRSPGRTLVLERFFENHPYGSSHGRTRILRTAYAEGSVYVPLVLRARDLWRQLNEKYGQDIFRPTGVLLVGPRGSPEIERARASARSYELPSELLDGDSARRRFPMFQFASGETAVWDPGGGVLFPEAAIRVFRRGAHDGGVRFRWNSPVVRWEETSDGRVRVKTPAREFLASRVVLAAGAWLPQLVPDLELPLSVEQQTVFWFRAPPERHASYRGMPAFVWYRRRGKYFYGTPDVGEGVKIGGSEGQRIRDPGRRPPTSHRERHDIQQFRSARLPGLVGRPVRALRCLYTNAPGQRFIVDFHPGHPNILLASACSGHGFKFVTSLGEAIAKAVRTGQLPPALTPFRLPLWGPGR